MSNGGTFLLLYQDVQHFFLKKGKNPAGEMFFLVISPSRCLPGCNQLFVRKLCWIISLVMFCCDLVQQVRRSHNLVTRDVSNKCRANLILSSHTIRIIEVDVARDVSHNTNCMISLIDRACLASCLLWLGIANSKIKTTKNEEMKG